MWFRGLLGVAIITGTAYLFLLWYRDLPRPLNESARAVPRVEDGEIESPRSDSVLARISRWRPALDKSTALLGGALALIAWSLGVGSFTYLRLRRRGDDEPSSRRSNRNTRLRRPDGTELNVEEFGVASAPTVILTHGWGMDSTEWYYAKQELEKEYRLLVWDLPGAGLSTRAANNDYSIARFANDLHSIVEWSGASQILLVGHSIGGMILQTYARLYPASAAIRGIALVHTTYKNPVRTTRFGALYTAIEKPIIIPLLYLTIGLSPMVWLMNVLSYLNGSTHRSTDKQSFSGNETRGQLEFAASFVLAQSPGVLARGMLGMIHFDESNNLQSIAIPTLVVPGENDPVTLTSASQVLTDSIPNARSVTIPMGRHQGQMEMHYLFLGALKGFARNSFKDDALPKTRLSRSSSDGFKSAP